MLAALGDLVEDIVVRLGGPIQLNTDTASTITHRQGGSAANVAVAARLAGSSSRFIGQVGDDPVGERLVAALENDGVEVAGHRGGRSGTVVAMLDARGERSMLTDRGSCAALDDPQPDWLTGVQALHVPLYSLVGEPLASTARTVIGWAAERGVVVSIDASSTAVIRSVGAAQVVEMLDELRPDVLFCNADEAAALFGSRSAERLGVGVVVVKHGDQPAIVLAAGGVAPISVPAETIDDVRDTTGAGDAFAAGYLVAMIDGGDLIGCVAAGHRLAAATIRRRSAALSAGPGGER